MAFELVKTALSFPADEDLTVDQYKVVVLDATSAKVRRPNAATDIPLGILQNAPKIDEEAVVVPIGCGGVSKVVLGASIGIGVIVGMEYNDAADAGKAIAAVATQYPVGVLLQGGAEDDLGSILMAPLTVKA
jgi:hypothetical protein